MLQKWCQSVLEAEDRDRFGQVVGQFAEHLGFKTYTAMSVVDQPVGRPDFYVVHNFPEGFLETAHSAEQALMDPVMQHCKTSSLPIVWGQDIYSRNNVVELWEDQASFGFKSGICVALHLPAGRHFLLGLDRDKPLNKLSDDLTRNVADLQLFAVYAQEAAMRILVDQGTPAVERPSLAPRELECLRWTMEGKTAWEVGSILSISERTVVAHLAGAMNKLGCTSKHQAVVKALRCGLIR